MANKRRARGRSLRTGKREPLVTVTLKRKVPKSDVEAVKRMGKGMGWTATSAAPRKKRRRVGILGF